MNKKHSISLFLVALSTSTAAEASTCTVGNYDPANGSACVPAQQGYYVPVAGASTETPASAGFFVANSGSSQELPAPLGHYVSMPAATSASAADPGYYVPVTGATRGPEATPGHYVPTAGADHETLADPGYFVATPGATRETPAPLGTFINTAGATAPTPAPAGTYISSTGATTARLATVGNYVPNAGSSSERGVSSGFYAPTNGAANELPAGGMAAPVTSAIQTQNLFNDVATDMLEQGHTSALKLGFGYRYDPLAQQGLSGDLTTNIEAIVLQANLARVADNDLGLQIAYGHDDVSGDGLSGSGDSYEAAAFGTGALLAGTYQASYVFGQTSYSNQRNVNPSFFSAGSVVTNNENDTSNGTVTWTGVRTHMTEPVIDRVNVFGELGLLDYDASGIRETATATSGGAPTTAVSGLDAKELNYFSVPATLGMSYDLVAKQGAQKTAPVTVGAGLTGDFAGTQNLRLTSQHTAGYSFDLPIQQTSEVQGLFNVKFNGWDMGDGFNVNGGVQTQFSGDAFVLEAGVHLVKQF